MFIFYSGSVLKSNDAHRSRGYGSSTKSVSPNRLKGSNNSINSRRNRFIVLGSSGEVLPVNRKSLIQMSVYDSCSSQSSDSYHSARDTIDEESGNN